ncbi:PKHD1L1, partial [Symbiodinium sp. KB8]
AEERVIGEVLSPTKYKVTRPFAFEHRADVFHGERLGHSAADMRGEVGLLTRNIVIQGDEHSTAQDFGAHTMAMGGGVYRVENAEFRRCGQSFLLGRYCTHAHMAGRFDRSYVKANSIHHSFQREFNVIEENLVAVTLRCSACLKGDTKPASFWTASPRQFWRHNRAAGCTNDGYWLELPGHPHGPSFTLNTCPNHEHLGEFFNNTAHSNGVHGLRLYPVVLPRAEPCSNTIVPYPMYFLNFTTFRNGMHGVFGKLNGDIHHINVKSLENVRDDLFWTKLAEVRYREDDAHIQNGLFVGSIDPQRAPRDKVGVFAPQREFFHIDGATFVNYGRGALATCAKCGEQMSLAQGGFTYRVEGLVFVNSTQRVKWGPGRKDIIYDLDGSLTGRGPRSWASPYWSFNAAGTAPACTRENSATATYDDAILCDASVEVRRIGIDMYEPDELRAVSLGVSPVDHPVYEDNKVGFLFKEIAGWVFPIVTRRWIRLWFHNTPLDWHELQIRFSEPDYIGAHAPESEWVGLKLNWTDTRYRNKVLYGKGVQDYWGEDIASEAAEVAALGGIEEFPTLPDREPLPSDHFGTGWLERRNSPGFLNNTWSLMLNNVFNSSRDMPLDALSGRYGTHRVFVKNLQCPPRGCPVPGVDIRPGTPMLWSAPSTWHHMRDMWGLSETEPDRLPREGDDVTVPPSMWLVLDVADTPALGHLRIEGRLTFADSKDLTLTLHSALVLGEWQIGSPDAPFQHAARVEFVGGRNSPAVIVDNSQFLSNKVLGVYGNLTVYGKPAGVTWTRLAASAGKGATELTLQQPVSWGAGDEIVISATEYDARQSEVRHIVAVSNGGFTLHLSSPLEFAHFGNEQRIAGRQLHLAAGVGLLTRSVTFSGIITDSTVRINSPWPTMYGFHIYAGEFKRAGDGAGVREFIGRIDMNNARLNNSAKAGTTVESDDDAASVTTSERPQHRIVGCSFSHSNNYAIRFEGAPGMVIHDNVIHSTFRSAVYDPVGDSPGARIEGNFVVGVHHSPDEVATAGTSSSWIFPFAGMYLFSRVASLQGNLVAASDDAGFTLRPPLCGGVGEVVRDNEAHSVLIGAFLIGAHVNERVQCQAFSDFTVWKAAHMGVFTTDQTSHMRISRVVVSDSHVGMALNYFRTARTSFSNVSDSVFIGQSQASSCDESVQCRAQMDDDPLAEECNSEVGPDYRSVGIMLPQYTNRAKTCYSDITSSLPKEACWPPTLPERTCNMPWEHRHGLASTRHAQLVLKGVTFSNFAADSCGLKSAAVKSHPSQSEFGVPVSMSSMRWEGVDEAARFSLAFEHANEKCTSRGCDGFDAAFVLDEDGSTFSVPAALVRHPAMAVGRTCTSATAWGEGALICPDLLRLRGFVTESLDRDRSFRRLEPVAVSRSEPGTPAGVAAYGAHGPLSDACAKRFFFAQYHSALLADGNTVLLNVTGTLPSRFRMHFMSPDPDEGVVIALFVRRPFRMNVYHGTRKVEALAEPGRLPTVADPHGTNVYIPQANTLWVTVRGHSTYASYTIVRTAEVQLDLTLAMSVADFYSSAVVRNLATLLNINPDQIRVADVQAASTKVTLYILPPGGQAAAEVVPPADDPDPRAVSPDFQEDAQPTLPSFINPVVEPNATAAGASTVAVPDGDLLTTSWDDSGYESMLDEVAEYAAVIEEAAKSGELTQALGVEVLALSISRPSTNSTANSTSGDVVVIQRQEPEPAGDSDSAVAPLLLGILVGAGGAATLAAAIMSYLMFCKSPPRPVPAAKSRVAPAASSSIQRDAH